MMHKKDMIFLSILIACSESVVLFYFCSAKSPRSFLCMMISYAILLIFPLNIFLASLREHRTGTSLSTLETTEESSKQQREIEQFTHKQLKLHKNNFTQKLKELYILLEQNDLTTAQKILGEQIPLKDTDIICCNCEHLFVIQFNSVIFCKLCTDFMSTASKLSSDCNNCVCFCHNCHTPLCKSI